MSANEQHQGQPTAGPGATLAWTRTRGDLPRAPWTDTTSLPLRAAVRVDTTARTIAAPNDRTDLGRSLRLVATIAGRYGMTTRQMAAAKTHADPAARPHLNTAHALVLNAMSREAARAAGAAFSLDDGTAWQVAQALQHADAATAWRYAVAYLDDSAALPVPLAEMLAKHHPQVAQALSDNRENIETAIQRAANLMTYTSGSRRADAHRWTRHLARLLALVQDEAVQKVPTGVPDMTDTTGLWSRLTVELPPLVVANYARTGRTYIPADAGRHPRYMARALTDPSRRVFHRRGGFRYATIVADLSGSMSLRDKDIADLVDAARGCSLLAYSTLTEPSRTAQVIARDGRACDPSRRMRPGGGNGVDGPALTWAHRHLRRHGAPLIWISDGGITGAHEVRTKDLARDMVRRLRDTGAHQVQNTSEALTLLAQMRAGRTPRPQIGARLLAETGG